MVDQGPSIVAITGANRGIGKAIADETAARGLTTIRLIRSLRPATAGSGSNDKFVDIRCDVTDQESVDEAFAEIGERFGVLHALVNNAGIHQQGPAESFPPSEFERVLRTNVTAVYRVSQAAYKSLASAKASSIVNIGSFFAQLGVKRNSAYCASKAAIEAMTRCLAVEWGGDGITVVNVSPGYVRTEINDDYLAKTESGRAIAKKIPVKRVGEASEIGAFVGDLVARRNPYLTGTTVTLDGGLGVTL